MKFGDARYRSMMLYVAAGLSMLAAIRFGLELGWPAFFLFTVGAVLLTLVATLP